MGPSPAKGDDAVVDEDETHGKNLKRPLPGAPDVGCPNPSTEGNTPPWFVRCGRREVSRELTNGDLVEIKHTGFYPGSGRDTRVTPYSCLWCISLDGLQVTMDDRMYHLSLANLLLFFLNLTSLVCNLSFDRKARVLLL